MEDLSFGSRLWLALVLPFKVLFDGALAADIARLRGTPALPSSTERPPLETDSSASSLREPTRDRAPSAVEAAVEAAVEPTPALQLLAILQREGRFIDFLQEDMSGFGDAEIGAAARVVQDGCRKGLAEYVEFAAIRSEPEGARVELAPGYDAQATRVTGNVTGQPPYRGTLAHHGWRVTRITLPQLAGSHDPRIVAPAEVEIGAG